MNIFQGILESPCSSIRVSLCVQNIVSVKALAGVFTHYQTIQHFNALVKIHIAVENVVRKGEIACNNQFLLFSQCFLPYMALFSF